jgi:glycosyltransferase involved in cell wall biosynthesis
MKILYITRARIPSEKAHAFQIVTMCKSFSELGHEVVLVVPERKNEIRESLSEYYKISQNFELVYLKVTPVIYNRLLGAITYWIEALLFSIRSLFLEIPKDTFVFTRSIEVAFLHALLKRKVMYEIHDWPSSKVAFYVFLLKKIPYLVVTAKGLGEELDLHGITSYLIASNGVGKEYFEVTKNNNLKKLDYGIDENKFTIMYVGSLAHWKGVSTLLESTTFIDEDKYQCVIAGGSDGVINQLRAQYPKVRFIGRLPNEKLPEFQQLADVLVVPNRTDSALSAKYTSPIKLFAHMASKKPVIATDIQSIRDIATDEDIFFFNGTARDLAKKIELVQESRNLSEMKSRKAYEKIQLYTWENRAKKIISKVFN